MRAFFAWLTIALAAFGSAAGGYHLYLENAPRHVIVVVDASFPMRQDWARVPDLLRSLRDQRYSTFSLYTEKRPIHSAEPAVTLGRVTPYAPRDFSKLEVWSREPVFEDASEVVLITNAPEAHAGVPSGWTVLRPR